MKLASGNQADSSCFGKIAVEYQKQLEVDSLIVADCALYTESNLKLMSGLRWLCRVPLSIKSAESLGMIMGLCLLVYTLAQRQIRAALKESKSTIKNQLGKATDRPTLRWIFQCFQCIHLVEFNNEKQISNWTQNRDFILNLLPDDCLRYYQLIT